MYDEVFMVYVVGEVLDVDEDGGTVWDLLGVYSTEQEALETIESGSQFIGPTILDEPMDPGEWPGLYYPLSQEVQ